MPAERLEFEITEGVLLEETERNLNSLRELKHMGISIALDDFGVGYSSLAYLTKFPFDKVKIDKSFIDSLDRTETSAVISSIVELAKSLNLAIIAEGIETKDQRKRIRSLGIKFGQGFLFAEPVPVDRLKAWGSGGTSGRGGRGGRSRYGFHLSGVTSSGVPFLELIQPLAVRRHGQRSVYGPPRPSVTCSAISSSNGAVSIGFQP